ncbi:MAG: DUF3078 domain-containing protein [Prevotellaceae bacterium]|jgi:hypothetical protein|nr:DUF3078 domain-containing protein [Prevotellaceae bacterium]
MKNFRKLILTTFLLCNISNNFAQTVRQDSLTQATLEAAKSVSEITKTSTSTAADLQKIKLDSAKYWHINGMIGLNTSATFLSNWAAGGNNVATMVAAGNIRIIYQKNKFAWETFFDTDFGYSYMDIKYNQWRKSNDKINLSSKAGYSITKTLYLTALGSFRTQYSNGFEYFDDHDSTNLISRVMSPSYTDLSVGLDYKPTSYFSLYYSPAAARLTTVLDTNLRAKYYGTIASLSKPFKFEGGMAAKAALNWQYKTLKIVSALTLFTPYNESFGNIDVDWDLSISYQFLKVLNVSLGTTMKYYDAILIPDKEGNNPTQRIQFKNVIGIGIGYTF